MRKKRYDDTPEGAAESMVAVHNFLNEGTWGEIVVWERSISRHCAVHNNNSPDGTATEENGEFPRLVRFQGRSKDLTPLG
jgi:cytochrome c heme-lyase